MSITEFKTHCLRLVDEVHRTHEPIEITKRGKKIAVVSSPVESKEIDWTPGGCADTVTFVGDVTTPVFDPNDLDLERQWF